ncbi:hypothetical protein ACMGDH_17530 [Sphingomonas sp. DT-207]|uniref:hypothetical protein n=1 Tax=Sphingomonas sp. DT-207 TaxID=3396167 RepID=UPI003F19CC87
MPTVESIAWFKQNFGTTLAAMTADTVFDVNMLTAIACQETGYIWDRLRKKPMSVDRILELCVGDTIDARSVFPRSRAELEAWPRGEAMFAIARAALIDMAQHVPGYAAMAARPNKFCHGFGLFQYDIQFFKVDPDYFLERRYIRLNETAGKCIAELESGLRKLGWSTRPHLSDMEKAAVAICYNTGRYNPARGLKQGHRDSSGRYYGENFFAYLKLAATVTAPTPAPTPTPAAAEGVPYVVETSGGKLNLRGTPRVNGSIVAKLPDGHPVQALSATPSNGFLQIRTTLAGAQLQGWASAQFLRRVPAPVL